jgi:hypothetical protein
MMGDNFLHQKLYPCRYAHDEPNVPFVSLLGDFFQFKAPVFLSRDFFTGLVIGPEPVGDLLGLNPAKIAFKMLILVVQIGTASEHQEALFVQVVWQIFIMSQREDLADTGFLHRTGHGLGYRNVLGGSLRGTRA